VAELRRASADGMTFTIHVCYSCLMYCVS
jgi:hypothetical protein